jgi:hypothetical protein
MTTLQERSQKREQLVKIAKSGFVDKAAKLYISLFRSDLEHLDTGDQVPATVPVGKDKFVEWTKEIVERFFPKLSGILENDELLKGFAIQVADAIGKSSTPILNPMRDYEKSQDPIFIRAQKKKLAQNYTPAKPDNENLYTTPIEHSRYCPEHPGAMMRRVSDNVYQCPISGNLNTVEPWKEKFDYRGGHEVRFETGVHNQTSEGWNHQHPIAPFLSPEVDRDNILKPKGKPYDYSKLYGVKTPDLPKKKEANILSTLIKVAEEARMSKSYIKNIQELATNIDQMISPEQDLDDWVDAKIVKANEALSDVHNFLKNYPQEENSLEQMNLVASTKTAQQLFAPTTMMTRQCPDHPGQQLIRIADNLRQCPLDSKVYDFVRGFTTEDGVKHNGGSVNNQQAIPPGSIIIKKEAELIKEAEAGVHAFLYNHVLPHLPSQAEYARRVLNYKFSQPAMTLEQAIKDIQKADQLVAIQKQEEQKKAVASSLKLLFKKEGENL